MSGEPENRVDQSGEGCTGACVGQEAGARARLGFSGLLTDDWKHLHT